MFITGALLIAGCAAGESEDNADDRPTLADLESTQATPADPYFDVGPPRPRVRASCIALPLVAPLEQAWPLLSTSGLPPELVELWRAKGMYLGVLDANDAARFTAALGPVNNAQRRLVYGWSQDVSAKPQAAGGQAATIKFKPGKMQLLVNVKRDQDDQVHLHVVPHYHVKVAIEEPSSKITEDVNAFDALKVEFPMDPDQLLVIGLIVPVEVSAPSELPPSPGRALLTSARLGNPLQWIIVFTADPEPAPHRPDTQ